MEDKIITESKLTTKNFYNPDGISIASPTDKVVGLAKAILSVKDSGDAK